MVNLNPKIFIYTSHINLFTWDINKSTQKDKQLNREEEYKHKLI